MEQLSLFNYNFYEELNKILQNIISTEELPANSLHLYSNISSKTKEAISRSICIYEPDYPNTKENQSNLGRNSVVMNIQDAEDLELLIRNKQFSEIPLPPTATVKQITSDKNFIHVIFSKNDNNIFSYIYENIIYCLKHYESKAKPFGCCSKFKQCSDAKKCIHENKLYSMACSYRRNLDAGRIFYGENRNI